MTKRFWIPLVAVVAAIACAMWVWPVTITIVQPRTTVLTCESLVTAYPDGASLRFGAQIASEYTYDVSSDYATDGDYLADRLNIVRACDVERSNRQTNLILFVMISSTVLILMCLRQLLSTRATHREAKPAVTDEE